MIRVNGLQKKFKLTKDHKKNVKESQQDPREDKDFFHSVRDVSFHCNQGEVLGLLGPNGAGKTTCFYMIVGLQACDKGEIYLDEHLITAKPMHQRARLGISYLPQEASVFRKLSVADNILAILELRRDLTTSDQQNSPENYKINFSTFSDS